MRIHTECGDPQGSQIPLTTDCCPNGFSFSCSIFQNSFASSRKKFLWYFLIIEQLVEWAMPTFVIRMPMLCEPFIVLFKLFQLNHSISSPHCINIKEKTVSFTKRQPKITRGLFCLKSLVFLTKEWKRCKRVLRTDNAVYTWMPMQ